VGDGPGAGVFRSVWGSLLVGVMKCSSHMVAVILPSLRCKADTRLWCCHTTRPSLQKQHKEHEMQEAIHGAHSFVPIGHKAGAWPARRWSGHVFAQSVHSMHPPSLHACASGTQCAQVIQSAWQHYNAALSERTQSAARPHSTVCGGPTIRPRAERQCPARALGPAQGAPAVTGNPRKRPCDRRATQPGMQRLAAPHAHALPPPQRPALGRREPAADFANHRALAISGQPGIERKLDTKTLHAQ
jgi:hypothetical protein